MDSPTWAYDVWYQARAWLIEIDAGGFPFAAIVVATVAAALMAAFVRTIGDVFRG